MLPNMKDEEAYRVGYQDGLADGLQAEQKIQDIVENDDQPEQVDPDTFSEDERAFFDLGFQAGHDAAVDFDIASRLDEVYSEGYEQGREDGFNDGYDEAMADVEIAEDLVCDKTVDPMDETLAAEGEEPFDDEL